MEEPIMEKLNLENAIADLRKEYKNTLAKTQDAKAEYKVIVAAVDSKTKLLEDQKQHLAEVIEDISQEKLKWALEKDEEWRKVNDKLSEAENVIKRKRELNEQEQLLRNIDAKTQEKLVENRNLEFKLQQDKTALEVERRQVLEERKKSEQLIAKSKKGTQDFKEQIVNLLKLCQEKL